MKAKRKYLKSLLKHKYYVYKSGRIVGVSRLRLILHDWTKFLPSEFLPYAYNFYGNPVKGYASRAYRLGFYGVNRWHDYDYVQKKYNQAWMHHQNRNPHHYQYWVVINDSSEPIIQPLPMPKKYLDEMIADWMGASWAYQGDYRKSWDWFKKNEETLREFMHPESFKYFSDNLFTVSRRLI